MRDGNVIADVDGSFVFSDPMDVHFGMIVEDALRVLDDLLTVERHDIRARGVGHSRKRNGHGGRANVGEVGVIHKQTMLRPIRIFGECKRLLEVLLLLKTIHIS